MGDDKLEVVVWFLGFLFFGYLIEGGTMKRITDPSFKYTPAVQTDIRKTFERIREEQRKEKQADDKKVMRMPERKTAR